MAFLSELKKTEDCGKKKITINHCGIKAFKASQWYLKKKISWCCAKWGHKLNQTSVSTDFWSQEEYHF